MILLAVSGEIFFDGFEQSDLVVEAAVAFGHNNPVDELGFQIATQRSLLV